jgi:hypothetical protein
LVPDAIIQDDTEAAIAKVAELGLEEGNRDFYVVVLSLINVVMLHVTVENGLTTVNRIQITEISTLEEDIYQEDDPPETLCQRRGGLISLTHFFNAAAD